MKVFSLKSFCYRVVYPTLPLFFLPSSSPSFPLSPSSPFLSPPFTSSPLPFPSLPSPFLLSTPGDVEDEEESAMASAEEQKESELQVHHSSRRCLNQDLVCCLLKCLRSGLWSLISKHCTRFLDHPFLKLLVLLWFKR